MLVPHAGKVLTVAILSLDGRQEIVPAFVRGVLITDGCFAITQASDNPVKARFVPLGEFIKRVGPAPSDVALVTYLQRLKEQGWNVDRTERKMLMCGVNSIAEDKEAGSALAGETWSAKLREPGQ